ncbi:MAG: hypothetical protein ACOWWM_01305 [Desulfobacterales bacterium]
MTAADAKPRTTKPACRLFVIFCITIALAACGKKGPPRLADLPELPVVADLAYRLKEQTVVLEWSLPKGGANDASGFYVYRSRSPVSEPLCETCPLAFEKVGIVSIGGSEEEVPRFSYREPALPGYRYAFMVRAYRESDPGGGDSNRVAFVVPENP